MKCSAVLCWLQMGWANMCSGTYPITKLGHPSKWRQPQREEAGNAPQTYLALSHLNNLPGFYTRDPTHPLQMAVKRHSFGRMCNPAPILPTRSHAYA